MAVKIIKCPWCEGEARITYEENRVYQMKCYSCHNTMLHVDHSFDSAVEFFEHQANLLQAEQDGSLVVLPCKVGDMVYEVCNNTDACSGCRNYEGIYGSGESWCTRIDDVDLRSYPDIAERPLCEKQFMEVVEHKPKADWIFNHRNDFGKTVFLTREEAEAALKGGEG